MPLVYAVSGRLEPYPEFDQYLREKRGAKAYQHNEEKAPETHQTALVAQQIMKSPVTTVSAKVLISDAYQLMREHSFRHLPVLGEHREIIGIISDRDLLHMLPAALSRPVDAVMTRRVLTATPDTSIRTVATVMLRERVSALPIVDPSRRLLGILTITDILKAIVEKAPIELWA